VPIAELKRSLTDGVGLKVKGIHVHNSCLCESWVPLLETVSQITAGLDSALTGMEWINLGGGYLWGETTDFSPLREAVDLLTNKYDLQVFIEPGAGIVNSAGYLVASVIDIFKSDGKNIAVLDATVNHLPEIFEYDYEPDLLEHVDDARHEYILAGCSCLAGDLFGEYQFEKPLEIGSRVTFANVGAYSLVKAHMFNGINLPSIYTLHENGELELGKRFTYQDFLTHCGVNHGASIRTGTRSSRSGGQRGHLQHSRRSG
jgi:carboxynorspermidine decarboxylase